jgi:polyferredoxin
MAALEVFIPILAVGGFWACMILLVYMFFSSRHRERMALLDRGLDGRVFSPGPNRHSALKLGTVAFMTGIGVFAGYLLSLLGLPEPVAYFTAVLLFAGTGLVSYYFLAKEPEEKYDEQV